MRTTSKEDAALIGDLLNEMSFKLPEHFNAESRSFWVCRIIEVHEKVPLSLAEMVKAAKEGGWALVDVTHDLGGMRRHWDGSAFTDYFWPRFAVNQ